MAESLEDVAKDILDFEKLVYKYTGAKEEAIHSRFGMSAAHYYQRLNRLIDQPQAEAYAPFVVRRLRAARAARTGTEVVTDQRDRAPRQGQEHYE